MQTSGRGRRGYSFALGAAHEQLGGDLSRASEVYAQAAAEDRNDTSCLRALGRSYEALRQQQSACRAYLAQAAEADDQHERLVTLRRVAELAQRELSDPEIAISALQQIVRAAEDDLLSLYQLVALSRLHRRTAVLHESLQLLVERTSAGEAPRDRARGAWRGARARPPAANRGPRRPAYARALDASPGYTPALRLSRGCIERRGRLRGALDPLRSRGGSRQSGSRRARAESRSRLPRGVRRHGRRDHVRAAGLRGEPGPRAGRRHARAAAPLRGAPRRLLRPAPRAAAQQVAILDAHHAYELGLIAEARARAATNDAERMRLREDALQYHRSALPASALARLRVGTRPPHPGRGRGPDQPHAAHHDAAPQRPPGRSSAWISWRRPACSRSDVGTVSEARSCATGAPAPARRSHRRPRVRHAASTRGRSKSLLRCTWVRRRLTRSAPQSAMLVEAAERLVGILGSEDLALAAEAVTRAQPGPWQPLRGASPRAHAPHARARPGPAEEAVSVRAVRAQNDLEQAIFYLESAELLERSGDTARARRAYRASLAAVPGRLPGELGLARTSSAATARPHRRPVSAPAARGPPSTPWSTRPSSARTRPSTRGHPGRGAGPEASQQVLQRDGSHRDAFRLLERIVENLDRPSPAVEVLREFFWSLSDADLRHDLGILLSTYARDTDERVRALRAATIAGNKDGLERLVQAYRDAGDDESAAVVTESLLGLALAGDATAFELRLGLARHLLESEGSQERALPHAEQLVAQSPKNSRGVTLLAEVLETLGRPLGRRSSCESSPRSPRSQRAPDPAYSTRATARSIAIPHPAPPSTPPAPSRSTPATGSPRRFSSSFTSVSRT